MSLTVRTGHGRVSVVVEELSSSGRVVGAVIDSQLDRVDTGSRTTEPEAVMKRSDVLGVQRCPCLLQFSVFIDAHVVNFDVVALNTRHVVFPSAQYRFNHGILCQNIAVVIEHVRADDEALTTNRAKNVRDENKVMPESQERVLA